MNCQYPAWCLGTQKTLPPQSGTRCMSIRWGPFKVPIQGDWSHMLITMRWCWCWVIVNLTQDIPKFAEGCSRWFDSYLSQWVIVNFAQDIPQSIEEYSKCLLKEGLNVLCHYVTSCQMLVWESNLMMETRWLYTMKHGCNRTVFHYTVNLFTGLLQCLLSTTVYASWLFFSSPWPCPTFSPPFSFSQS